MPEHVRPAPHRAERAQSRLMQDIEGLELRVDGFRAFDMKNRRQRAGSHAMADVLDRAADADPSIRLALDADQDGCGKGAPGAVSDTGAALSALVTWFLGEGTKIANIPPAKPP